MRGQRAKAEPQRMDTEKCLALLMLLANLTLHGLGLSIPPLLCAGAKGSAAHGGNLHRVLALHGGDRVA